MQLVTAKAKIFRAVGLNGIFAKIGLRSPHNLILSLIDSFCIPVLLYGLEALNVSKYDLNSLNFVYSSVFCKIFNVKENLIIQQCQYYSGCLPSNCRIDLRTLNFFKGLGRHKNSSLPLQLFTWFGRNEQSLILDKYSIFNLDNNYVAKLKCFNFLAAKLL